MSIRTRVMNVVRDHPELEVSQLRIGRIVTMEQKGHLDEKTDDDILVLLKPSPEKDALDASDKAIILSMQEEFKK